MRSNSVLYQVQEKQALLVLDDALGLQKEETLSFCSFITPEGPRRVRVQLLLPVISNTLSSPFGFAFAQLLFHPRP